MVKREAMKSRVVRVGAVWDKALELSRRGTDPRRVTVPLEGDETLSEAVRKFLERFVR